VRPRGPRTSAHIAHMIIEWISKEEAGVRLGVPGRPLSSRRVLELAREGKLQSQLVRDVDSGQMTTQIHAGSVERLLDERKLPKIEQSVATSEQVQHAARELRAYLKRTQKDMSTFLGLGVDIIRRCEIGYMDADYYEGTKVLSTYRTTAQECNRSDLAQIFASALNGNKEEYTPPQGREVCAPQPSQALALLREVCEGLRAAPSARLWLTLNEAADYSGLPAAVLLNFITLKKIQVLNVGRRRGGQWRIRRLDLDQFAG
jgi:hypothetical protein